MEAPATARSRLVGREGEYAEIDCDVPSGNLNPNVVEVSATIFRRTKFFVQVLKEACETKHGQRRKQVHLDPKLGFTIPDDPKSTIKKVLINFIP
jgi:hypothetical protein